MSIICQIIFFSVQLTICFLRGAPRSDKRSASQVTLINVDGRNTKFCGWTTNKIICRDRFTPKNKHSEERQKNSELTVVTDGRMRQTNGWTEQSVQVGLRFVTTTTALYLRVVIWGRNGKGWHRRNIIIYSQNYSFTSNDVHSSLASHVNYFNMDHQRIPFERIK